MFLTTADLSYGQIFVYSLCTVSHFLEFVVSTSAVDCLERLVCGKMYNLLETTGACVVTRENRWGKHGLRSKLL